MSQSSILAVLFDLGGVVLTSPLDNFAAYEQRAGLPAGLISRINMTDQHDNAWAKLERGEVDPDEFCRLFEAEAQELGYTVDAWEVLACLAGHIRPIMVTALHRLRAGGLQLAAVTNNVAPLPADGELGELRDLFDVVVESSVEGVRKPEPAFYQRALERLGNPPPSACAYLDDLGVNLKPARAMGIHTIKVADPVAALAELAQLTGLDLVDEAAQQDRNAVATRPAT